MENKELTQTNALSQDPLGLPGIPRGQLLRLCLSLEATNKKNLRQRLKCEILSERGNRKACVRVRGSDPGKERADSKMHCQLGFLPVTRLRGTV